MSAARILAATDDAVAWADPGVGRYIRALAALAPGAVLYNAKVEFAVLQLADRALPLVLPVGPQGCWLTSTAATYGPALRDEIARDLGGAAALFARAASCTVEGLLRATGADHAVYMNHLLFSTSLHSDWDGADLEGALTALRAAYPDRAILWRSLNAADHPDLLARMAAAGARRLPSRLVWRLKDPAAQWAPRTDVKADLLLAERQGFAVDRLQCPSPAELARVLHLYGGIYLDKYSRTNPAYTTAALAAAIEAGVVSLDCVRDASGEIVAFSADHVCGGELTGPILGHDRSRPPAEGLYRIVMTLPVQRALREGLSVNYSAGAATFKRNRGATPALEYTAVFDDHLPAWRRCGFAVLAGLLRALTPMLERRALG